MLYTPFYDPEKTYEENFKDGPFGDFTDGIRVKNVGEPNYSVFGQAVYLPFGIPAGPLLNGKFVKAALDKGFDIVTYKTVRTREYPSNEWPNVVYVKVSGDLTLELSEKGVLGNHEYSEPLGVTNSFGVPSFKPDFWQNDLADSVRYAKKGQLVIGSFQGTTNATGDTEGYIQDFAHAARLVKETGVKVLEVNLSCPNEGSAHLLCFDLERTHKVVHAIKNEIGNMPLNIKIAYFSDHDQLEKLVKSVGKLIDGIAAINTMPTKILNDHGEQLLPGGPGRLKAGVSGAPVKWAGLETVKKLKSLREKHGFSYTIFGMGGVITPNDYKTYRDAGADVVMSAAGAIWNPYLAQEIKKGLR